MKNKKLIICTGLFAIMCTFMLGGCSSHEHEWVEATCTEPATCATCGETEGEALGHTWVGATCTSASTCSVCGETNGEALGHTWVDATCTEPQTCSVCGETTGDTLDHTWVDATCTEPQTCSVCGEEYGEPAGHSVETWTVTVEATCTATGQQEGTCTVCGESVQEETDMLEHTAGEWVITTEATYSESGEKTQSCTVCGEVLATESYSLSTEEKIAYFKSECNSYTYEEIARNPDNYVGEYAKFTGEVIQVIQDTDDDTISYNLRVNVTKGKYTYSDTIFVVYEASTSDDRILEDDIVTIYGILAGDYTYTSVLGSSVTLPALYALYIDIE